MVIRCSRNITHLIADHEISSPCQTLVSGQETLPSDQPCSLTRQYHRRHLIHPSRLPTVVTSLTPHRLTIMTSVPAPCRHHLYDGGCDGGAGRPRLPAHLLHDPRGGLRHAVRPAHPHRRVRGVPQEAHHQDPQAGGAHQCRY